MKIAIVMTALIAVAIAAPAEAASKKRKKAAHRAAISTVQARPGANSNDVYVSGELVGRDPDPSIRAYMMRNPHIWDGPE